MIEGPLLLIALLAGHMLGDYPLQGDFLSSQKSRFNTNPIIPWYHAMIAHVTIHGAFVAILTGIPILFLAEAIIHFITDDAKCAKRISIHTDQIIHITCKFAWFFIALME